MTVLIVGGSGGVGAALARTLSARGVGVHIAGRNAAALKALGAEIGAPHTVVDVTGGDAADASLRALGVQGPLTGLVYAVGTITVKPFGTLTAAEMTRDFAVNALGAATTIQAVLPALKAAGAASVVLFSSVAVGQGFTGHASISMAKGAVEGLVRALAAELAPGIRVNGIAPSLTRTPLAAQLTDNAALAKAVADLHAMRRLGEPDDLAALAAFLLAPESGWITGQVIGVDGGRSALRTKG